MYVIKLNCNKKVKRKKNMKGKGQTEEWGMKIEKRTVNHHHYHNPLLNSCRKLPLTMPTKPTSSLNLLTKKDIEWIRELIDSNPDWHRTRLSREICTGWNWVNAAGQLKEFDGARHLTCPVFRTLDH